MGKHFPKKKTDGGMINKQFVSFVKSYVFVQVKSREKRGTLPKMQPQREGNVRPVCKHTPSRGLEEDVPNFYVEE